MVWMSVLNTIEPNGGDAGGPRGGEGTLCERAYIFKKKKKKKKKNTLSQNVFVLVWVVYH
jgi:hypothetical protein